MVDFQFRYLDPGSMRHDDVSLFLSSSSSFSALLRTVALLHENKRKPLFRSDDNKTKTEHMSSFLYRGISTEESRKCTLHM